MGVGAGAGSVGFDEITHGVFAELGDAFSPGRPAMVCTNGLAELDGAFDGRPGLGSAIGAWAERPRCDFLVLAELGVVAEISERDRVEPNPPWVIVEGHGGDTHRLLEV